MRKTTAAALLTGVVLAGAACSGAPQAVGASAPGAVAGKVFLDANGNGRLDPGEKGIAGVRVTNGVNFVTTDGQGSYTIKVAQDETIPYRPAQVVSMSWPSGKWPTGRWWWRISEIKDTGTVNFPLRSDEQKLPFIYLHHTDSHGDFVKSHEDFARFVNALGEVKFIFDTGDTSWPLEGLLKAESQFEAPFFHAIGNHDINNSDNPPPDLKDYGAWTRVLGPVRWSFNYAGIHVASTDVTGGLEGTHTPADWLERDLKGLPAGTRIILAYHYPNPYNSEKFLRLLKDYKIEMIHAGHNHAYMYWGDLGWPSPMMTAYTYRPPGTANVGIVTEDGVDVAVYCIGCRGGRYAHSRRCPMSWLDHVLLANIRSLFGQLHKIENRPLDGQGETLAVSEDRALVQARIDPGSAKKVGLRVGPKEKPLEIAYTGDHLSVAGTSVPFKFRQQDKTLDLAVFVQKDMLTVWANDCFFFEKPVKLERAAQVSAFAASGKATIKTLTVQEVKPDPPGNRDNRYRCSCAHGALRRTP